MSPESKYDSTKEKICSYVHKDFINSMQKKMKMKILKYTEIDPNMNGFSFLLSNIYYR